MVFPVSIVIGYGIRYLRDKWFGITSLKIVFLLFGVAAGFVNLVTAEGYV
jgi:F0F1-type ATP synthase assembly protein I